MDLSGAASLESIGIYAFGYTRITGTLVIPANVETIGEGAFLETKLTGLDLSDAASLKSIGASVFRNTDITGTIVTPFNIPTSRGSCFPCRRLDHHDPVAPSGAPEPCWELADPTMTDIPADFLKDNTDLTGTLKLGAAVKMTGSWSFYLTKLTGLDLSDAISLVSIGDRAFAYTDITGTLVIPANVETIGEGAFEGTKLKGLDLSDAASLASIGNNAFTATDITGTLKS